MVGRVISGRKGKTGLPQGNSPEATQQLRFAAGRRLKIGWVTEAGASRRSEMEKRLAYLVKNTREGRMYGTMPLLGTGIGEG